MQKKLRMNRFHNDLFDIINIILLLLFTAVVLYPFIYCFILSFNDGQDTLKGGIYIYPRVFTLENYKKVFSEPVILYAIRNTVLRTVIGIVVFLLVTGMYSYAVSRKYLLFRKFYINVGIIVMYFNGGLIPTYLVMRSLGLINNFLVYILPNFFTMFYAMIMIANFSTIPPSLEESAMIDGASYFTIFFSIVVPTSKAIMACIALFIGVTHWNAWLDTMLYTSTSKLQTLSHLLVTMVNNQQYLDSLKTQVTNIGIITTGATSSSIMMATMIVTSFPIIVLYPLLQKHFIKGVMVGSIKG